MTMKNFTKTLSRLSAAILIFAFLMTTAACGGRKTAYIFILDLTESVSAEARARSFEAVKARARLLRRGDSLTIIPIAADAQIETSGKVLHLEVGEKRKLADADLDEFFARAETALDKMQAESKTYGQSDVLGALRVALEEIAVTDKREKRVVVAVLSDMVHSTKEIRFETDARLAKAETARQYAESFAENEGFKETEIFLGFLESSDARKMNAERREAAREFWQTYFKRGAAARLQFATDGTGQLEKFINAKSAD